MSKKPMPKLRLKKEAVRTLKARTGLKAGTETTASLSCLSLCGCTATNECMTQHCPPPTNPCGDHTQHCFRY
jgi:hypothetical protein